MRKKKASAGIGGLVGLALPIVMFVYSLPGFVDDGRWWVKAWRNMDCGVMIVIIVLWSLLSTSAIVYGTSDLWLRLLPAALRAKREPEPDPEPEPYEPEGPYATICKSLKRLENTIEDAPAGVNLQNCVETRLRLSALDIPFPVVPDNRAFGEWLWASRRVRAALEIGNIEKAREVWPEKHG